MDVYDVGDGIELFTVVTNAGGTLVDPGALYVVVEPPGQSGTVYAYPASVTREALGSYYYGLTLGSAGYWTYRWVGSAPSVSEEGRLFVRYVEAGTV